MIVTRRTALGLMPAVPGALRALTQAPAVARLRRFISDGSQGFVIEPDGRVNAWTWGNTVQGFALGLGHDRVVPPYVAQEVPALGGAVAIAVEYDTPSYAAMADGRVLAWETSAPAPVPGLPKIVTLSSMGPHIVALTADGTVITTGGGRSGRFGAGHLAIAGLSGVAGIAAGWNYALALLGDGSIRAWGENRFGQLGDGTTEDRTRPIPVRGITNAVAVAAREDYSAALLADGTVMTWGKGHEGLGRGDNSGAPKPVPQLVPGVTGITAIALGGLHMLALHRSGGVMTWGFENVARPVGHPGTPASRPAAVPLVTTARAVSAGPLASQALLADGSFMVWGVLPSLSFRIDGADPTHAQFPIPMVVKGL